MKRNRSMSRRLADQVMAGFRPTHRLPVVNIRRIPAQDAQSHAQQRQASPEGSLSFDFANAINRRRERQGGK